MDWSHSATLPASPDPVTRRGEPLLNAGWHGSYGIRLVVIVAVLAPIGIPLLVGLLGRIMDRPYGVPLAEIAGVVLTLILKRPA
jgi:hypothetical protein